MPAFLASQAASDDETGGGRHAWCRLTPAAILALLAAGVPLLVYQLMREEIVLPRLVATAALTGIALAAGALVVPRRALNVPRAAVPLTAAAMFVALTAFSTLRGDFRLSGLLGEYENYRGLLPLVLYISLMMVAAWATTQPRAAHLMLSGVVVGGALSAAYAVIQRLGFDWVQWQVRDPHRAGAAFAQPDVLGVELCVALFVAAGLWLEAKDWRRDVLAVCMAIIAAGLIFTFSRGAWIAAGAGTLTMVLMQRPPHLAVLRRGTAAGRRPQRADSGSDAPHLNAPVSPSLSATAPPATPLDPGVGASTDIFAPVPGSAARTERRRMAPWFRNVVVIAAVAAGIGVAVVSPAGAVVRESATRGGSSFNLRETSVSARIGLWRTAIEMVGDHPIFGSGADSFSPRFAGYRTIGQPGIGTQNVRPESSHNFLLDQLVSTGVLGTAAFVTLVASTLVLAWRDATDGKPHAPYVIGTVAALVAYYAAVFFSFSEAMTGWLPWLLLGVLLGEVMRRHHDTEAAVRAPLAPFYVLRGAVVLAGAMFLAGGTALLTADLYAGRAARAAGRGDPASAIEDARTAERINPLQKEYLLDRGGYEEDGAARSDDSSVSDAHLAAAGAAYHTANDRFGADVFTLLSEAVANAGIGGRRNDPARTSALLEEAARRDPYNLDLRFEIAAVYRSLGNGERAAYHTAAASALATQ